MSRPALWPSQIRPASPDSAYFFAVCTKGASQFQASVPVRRTPCSSSQRVAVGRAIVRTAKVFLFDEPLSNLVATLRGQTQVESAKLHRELGATTIHVIHDQGEAMTLADRVVVLRDGRIEQVGLPLVHTTGRPTSSSRSSSARRR